MRQIDERQLNTSCERYCPLKPCVNCLRREQCDSFINYRKEHPEYDEKYALFESLRRSQVVKTVDELREHKRLCGFDGREQVPQKDCRPKRLAHPSSIINGKKIYRSRRTKIMKLDFSEVQELENKQCAEGEQTLTIKAAKQTKSANGNAMLVVDMVDAEEGFTRDNIMLEGSGAFKAKQFIAALGISEEEFRGMEPSDLVGQQLVADVIIEEYQDKTYAKIKKYIEA